ncbi:MAG: response regulator transcription factor [Firmicutes bacterium]|nr:response regulator transcription factor [Dethiobacter sp.]MBS3889191.1 response regulator transcription factor [Bacillota bacterium]
MPLRVLIADDHKLFREGLRRLLELEGDFQVVAEAATGEQAVQLLAHVSCDVALMDINMPVQNGVEATKRIKAEYPGVAVLVLTMHDDREYLLEVLKAGAEGYLLKDVEPALLMEAIRTVARGGTIVAPSLASKLVQELNRLGSQPASLVPPVLTSRETEILGLMAQGMNNAAIAKAAFISERTVKNHITSILRKLDVTDRTQAVIEGVKQGLTKIK